MGRSITEAHAERIMDEAGPPRFWTDDACAHGIKLTYAVRQALQITSIGSIDKTKAQRTRLRKERNRDREARRRYAAGAKPRGVSLSRTRPWQAEGISRRTWFRCRESGTNSCAPPLYPQGPAPPQSGHRGTDGTSSCAASFLFPQHEIVPITTRTHPSQVLRGEIMPTDWLTALGIPVPAESQCQQKESGLAKKQESKQGVTCSPSQGWARYPNLQRRPHSPNLGRGRLQRQIARAFEAHGPEVTTSTIYDWCMLWPVDKRSSQAQRWSIRRILDAIADRRGRASTIGRPWIWRLRKAPAADASSATPD
jgi:hypothetical protein